MVGRRGGGDVLHVSVSSPSQSAHLIFRPLPQLFFTMTATRLDVIRDCVRHLKCPELRGLCGVNPRHRPTRSMRKAELAAEAFLAAKTSPAMALRYLLSVPYLFPSLRLAAQQHMVDMPPPPSSSSASATILPPSAAWRSHAVDRERVIASFNALHSTSEIARVLDGPFACDATTGQMRRVMCLTRPMLEGVEGTLQLRCAIFSPCQPLISQWPANMQIFWGEELIFCRGQCLLPGLTGGGRRAKAGDALSSSDAPLTLPRSLVRQGINMFNILCDAESREYVMSLVEVKPRDVEAIIRAHPLSAADSRPVIRSMIAAAARDNEVQTDMDLSLRFTDPVSLCRMVTPVRGVHCTHAQCVDLDSMVQLFRNDIPAACPLCRKPLRLDADVYVDTYITSLLRAPQMESVDAVALVPSPDAARIIECTRLSVS